MRFQPSVVDVVGPVWRRHLTTNGPAGGVGDAVGVGLASVVALGTAAEPETGEGTALVPADPEVRTLGDGALEQAPVSAAMETTTVSSVH
jgi:hypothetical protein